MTTAAGILTMIEQVDPSDNDALDGIDARVWCFIHQEKYGEYFRMDDKGRIWVTSKQLMIQDNWSYTRSRDALKGIRPEGWKEKPEKQDEPRFSYVKRK